MLPLFEVVLGILLALGVDLHFLLGRLDAPLVVYLGDFGPREMLEVLPDRSVLHVILDKVSFGQELFAFVFELGLSRAVDKVHRHFLVVDHLLDLEFDSFLMLDWVSGGRIQWIFDFILCLISLHLLELLHYFHVEFLVFYAGLFLLRVLWAECDRSSGQDVLTGFHADKESLNVEFLSGLLVFVAVHVKFNFASIFEGLLAVRFIRVLVAG